MARIINTNDTRLQKTLKLIPSEIIALFVAAIQFVPNGKPFTWYVEMIVAIGCLILTPIYLVYGTKMKFKDSKTAAKQIIITTVAFAIWVFAIGGPFQNITFLADNTWISAIVLLFWNLILVMFNLEGIQVPAPTAPTTPPTTTRD
jgi:hypothetical protein